MKEDKNYFVELTHGQGAMYVSRIAVGKDRIAFIVTQLRFGGWNWAELGFSPDREPSGYDCPKLTLQKRTIKKITAATPNDEYGPHSAWHLGDVLYQRRNADSFLKLTQELLEQADDKNTKS